MTKQSRHGRNGGSTFKGWQKHQKDFNQSLTHIVYNTDYIDVISFWHCKKSENQHVHHSYRYNYLFIINV